jgi:hypothetical protein
MCFLKKIIIKIVLKINNLIKKIIFDKKFIVKLNKLEKNFE